MKINNSFLQGVIAILFGIILILWPNQASHYLILAIGLFFVLPGLYALFCYFFRPKSENAKFPIEALGSVVLGILLFLFPAFFISILMYLLGVLSVIGGISLIIMLFSNKKRRPVSIWYFVLPVVVLAGGIFILAKPEQVVESTFVIFGIVCILFGVSLLINWMKFRDKPERL